MTPEHLASVTELVDRWNSGQRTIPASVDPAVELESPFSAVRGEPYRGHEGIREWVSAIDDQFSLWRITTDEMRAVGENVLQIGRVHLRGRASQIELDQPFAVVATFGTDNRITRIRIYTEIDAARQAVGFDE
jgi:hypothetical protein